MDRNTFSINNSGITINTSSSFASPATSNMKFAHKLRQVIGHGLHRASKIAEHAAGSLPGAAVLSAAVSGAAGQLMPIGTDNGQKSLTGNLLSNNAGAAGGSGMNIGNDRNKFLSSISDMQNNMVSQNVYLLSVQRKFQQMNEQYSTISNVLKTKHDTEKNAIANIR